MPGTCTQCSSRGKKHEVRSQVRYSSIVSGKRGGVDAKVVASNNLWVGSFVTNALTLAHRSLVKALALLL